MFFLKYADISLKLAADFFYKREHVFSSVLWFCHFIMYICDNENKCYGKTGK